MKRTARIFHGQFWGLRGEKYDRLDSTDVHTSSWSRLDPQSRFYLFVPQAQAFFSEYNEARSIREIFRFDSVGVVTARDRLTIHLEQTTLLRTVNDFASLEPEAARIRYELGRDARDWKVVLAQHDLRAQPISPDHVRSILYRPFDLRWTYYTGKSRGFIGQPQQRMANQMDPRGNLGLCTARSIEIKTGWEHVFCTRTMIQHHAVSLKEVNYLFPLYWYEEGQATDLFFTHTERVPNLSPNFIADFSERLGMRFIPDGTGDCETTFGPEDVFHYMYAVFHSPTYRDRYAEFLKVDFPRLPLTTDAALFRKLCAQGAELTGLHLMATHAPVITRYPIAGDNTVDRPRYTAPGQGAPEGRVWINATQYFEGVAPELWEHRVGGYQVAEKWLKDRKGRALTYDDLTHYQRTLAALSRTRELMETIDATVERHGGWPLTGSISEA